MTTRWYVAVLVISSTIDGRRQTTTIDFQVRVFRAVDDETAFARANALGETEEHSYENADGETVSWHFNGLHDLQQLPDDTIGDGTEVYSMLRDGNPLDFVMPKEQLTVFWAEKNKDKTAEEILFKKRE